VKVNSSHATFAIYFPLNKFFIYAQLFAFLHYLFLFVLLCCNITTRFRFLNMVCNFVAVQIGRLSKCPYHHNCDKGDQKSNHKIW